MTKQEEKKDSGMRKFLAPTPNTEKTAATPGLRRPTELTGKPERRFEYNPNARKAMQPSAAQQAANDVVGAAATGYKNMATRSFKALPATKLAQGAVNMAGEMNDARKQHVANTTMAAGRAPDSYDEAPAARSFKVAAGQTPLRSAPSVRPELAVMPEKATARSFSPPAAQAAVPSVAEENMQQPAGGASEYTPERIESLKAAAAIPVGQENTNFVGRRFTAPGGSMTVTGPPPKQGQPQQRRFLANTTYNTREDGKGLDVTFAPGTSQDEARRFMAQPVRQGTVMRSGLVRPGEPSVRERYFAANMERNNGNAGQPQPGWKERNNIRDNQTRLTEQGIQQAGANTRQFSANAVTREGNMLDSRNDQEKNAIDRMQAESAGNLQDAQARKAGTEADLATLEADLKKQYVGTEDPAERAAVERKLLAVQGRLSGNDAGMTEKDRAQLRMDAFSEFNKLKKERVLDDEDKFEDWVKQQPWLLGIFDFSQARPTSFDEVLNGKPEYRERFDKASPEEQKRLREASAERARLLGFY